jgi:cytochrome c-type biogenesis protein CcmH/NrfF
VGVVFVLLVIGFIFWFGRRQREKRKRERSLPTDDTAELASPALVRIASASARAVEPDVETEQGERGDYTRGPE